MPIPFFSAQTPFIALGILPLVVNLLPNPIWFFWQIRNRANRSLPMPAELGEKMRTVGRYMLLFIDGSVVGLTLWMMRSHSVGIAELGLRAEQWKYYLSLGCTLGLSWAGIQALLLRRISRVRRSSDSHYMLEGSSFFWIMRFTLGVFAEELWRAFCLFAFLYTGYRTSLAVVLTVIAFAAAHPVRRVGGALGIMTLGLGLALLFVQTGSFLAIYAAHLVANLGALYSMRQIGRAERTRRLVE